MNMMSENINELMAALSKAQGQVKGAVKDSANPFFKSKYADLNSIWNACREALSANDLAVVQTTINIDGNPYLQTLLGHSSGQWIKGCMAIPAPAAKEGRVNELQVLGSSLTYLRRYQLAAMVGVAPDEDDDGNAANASFKAAPKAAEKPTPFMIKKITAAQANDLQMILDECSPKYRDWFFGVALKKDKIETLSEIPLDRFEKMKAHASADREECITKQREQFVDHELQAAELQ